jgi:hypothetical protein
MVSSEAGIGFVLDKFQVSWADRVLKALRAIRQYNMVIIPVGLGTENYCAVEKQQQFSSHSVSQSISQ